MTEAERIVEECERRGIIFSLGERSTELAFYAPAGAFAAELRARVVERKAEIIEILFEHEERAALAGAPDWADASMWARAVSHPALEALRRLGIEIISVSPLSANHAGSAVTPGGVQAGGR